MESESLMAPEEAHAWGMLLHLSAFSLFFTGIGYLLAPLALWLVKKDEAGFIKEQGKEVINFQLTSTFYFLITAALCFVLNIFILLYLVLIAWMVLVIQAAQAAGEGKSYRYPYTLRLIR